MGRRGVGTCSNESQVKGNERSRKMKDTQNYVERYAHYIILSNEGKRMTKLLYSKKRRRKFTPAKRIKLIVKDVQQHMRFLPF